MESYLHPTGPDGMIYCAFFSAAKKSSTLEDGNANLSLLVRCSIKEVMGWDGTLGRISSAESSRQQSRLGSYDLVSCLETESCF